mmetsp:Transcript_25145/g.40326  ORF Transcript_25145/g.40326 Transcript_25145/m.40326 type:complete len:241 (+) Transcript_25145:167-889(+)
MSAPAIHRQALPARARPHHRCGVRQSHGDHRQQADQAADLGHSRAGELPLHHALVLPRRCGGAACLRHYPPRNLQPPCQLARGREAAREPQHDHHAHRQQERHHASARSELRGGRGVCQGARADFPGDVGQDLGQRRGGVHQHGTEDLRKDRGRSGCFQRNVRDQGGVWRGRRRRGAGTDGECLGAELGWRRQGERGWGMLLGPCVRMRVRVRVRACVLVSTCASVCVSLWGGGGCVRSL